MKKALLELEIQNGDTALKSTLEQLEKNDIVNRIWRKDHTVWHPEPKEITNRLDWLTIPEEMKPQVGHLADFAAEIRKAGFTHALLLGMGGSSLAPEVFRKIFGVQPGFLDLHVLDSTHPEAVKTYADTLPLNKTLFIVSTKSGGTVETLSFMKYFYRLLHRRLGEKAGDQFVAITDPGSGLEKMARDLKFRKIFLNNPNIGGRFSALSYFGLVPAVLLGIDLDELLDRTLLMAAACQKPAEENPGALLGAFMGAFTRRKKDKLTLLSTEKLRPLGAWIEQLVAESTGKNGKGILPVTNEPLQEPADYSPDRQFVVSRVKEDAEENSAMDLHFSTDQPLLRIELRDVYDLGQAYFLWEFATAVAGHILEIHPFDQPNVESAKVAAREMVRIYSETGSLPTLPNARELEGLKIYGEVSGENPADILEGFINSAASKVKEKAAGPYIAIQAYINPNPENAEELARLQEKLLKKYGYPVTVGFGPRFLHSTGQLHKGDAGNGIFIQIVSTGDTDIPIPDEPTSDDAAMTFGVLVNAQSLGDRKALLDAGREVLRVEMKADVTNGLRLLGNAIQ
ncbi:MAG: hypothetical protein Kow0037_32410 [Calditrichia bacterium]